MELREKVVFFIFNKRSKYVLVQWESKLQNVFFWGNCASVGRAGHTLIGKSVVWSPAASVGLVSSGLIPNLSQTCIHWCVCMSVCLSVCRWQEKHCIAQLKVLHACVWVGACGLQRKALWVVNKSRRALFECSPFTLAEHALPSDYIVYEWLKKALKCCSNHT